MKQAVMVLALMPAMAFAQGSGSTGGSGIGVSGGSPTVGGDNPFQVTKVVTGTVVEVANGGLVIDINGKKMALKTDKKIRVKADKKTELGSRKSLTPDDLVAGMVVKVTYRPDDLVALDVKITKDKA